MPVTDTRILWYRELDRIGQSPLSCVETAVPTAILSNCDALVIGVIVTVALSSSLSTIGLTLMIDDLLPSTPSNSVVSTVADKEVAINFPNLFSELNPAKPTIPSP